MTPLSYQQFLKAKLALAPASGIEAPESAINPLLKPFTRDIVRWALRGGRRAIFASFGLHKTATQLEIMRQLEATCSGLRLIVMPLEVRHEFKRESRERFIDGYAAPVKFIRQISEVEDERTIYLTNYESVREGILDVTGVDAVSLDEAAVLAARGSKTFGEFTFKFFRDTRFRFVATATPSPNEFQELLSYAAFLDICDISQARTRFFKRDSTKADKLTIHPHKEAEFWLWISSWAVFLQRPSDLGYSDEGYVLPEADIHWHELPSDHARAGNDKKSGQFRLMRNAAVGVQDAAREKRESLPARIAKLLELRQLNPNAHRLIWHDLEAERHALEDALPRAQYENWLEYKDGNGRGLELYNRHYSAHQYADGRERKIFCGPGEKTVLLTEKGDALFVWRKFIDDSGQQGVNCAVFRNEGAWQSSHLIREAMAIAWMRWPSERLYTYINSEKVKSKNPGYCFIQAGWKKCGETKNGLLIFEALPDDPQLHYLTAKATRPVVTRKAMMTTVYGSQDLTSRENAIVGFSEGEIAELGGKPSMLGSGTNFQRHCSWAIFLGIGFKFRDFYQSIHRLQRYGQQHRVRLDLIYTEAERGVRAILLEKWEQHKLLVENMSAIIRKYGLATNALEELQRSMGVTRQVVSSETFTSVQDDSVVYTASMEAESVHLIATSIPFAGQYEYTPSYNDFGHTESNDHFFQQMDYLTPELYRVLMPGRICAIHVKDRVQDGAMTGLGFQTIYPFSDHVRDHFQKHGFAFTGRISIVTDVVRENGQTYRLGWSENCKDGTRMGAGLPEYLLLFRKPQSDRSRGYADLPVVKEKEQYSRARWQVDAHGFWRSNGDRLLSLVEELRGQKWGVIYRLFRSHSLTHVYDYGEHVKLGEAIDTCRDCGHIHTLKEACVCGCRKSNGRLPVDFMLLPPQSWHDEVWTDIVRMLTLNSSAGREKHICPLQIDLCDRIIDRYSSPGETVYDPFAGLGTVPVRAVKKGRRGIGCELNPGYFAESVRYLKAAEAQANLPTLFQLEEAFEGAKENPAMAESL